MPTETRKHYRAVFTSDWHLGFRGAKTNQLLAFLNSFTCDYLYLVGDIPDVWELMKHVHWDGICTAVVRRVLEMNSSGTKIYWTPGNHDEAVRPLLPISVGVEIQILDHVIHVTSSGKKYVVIHGDQFDFVMGHMEWLAKIGNTLYSWLIAMNATVQMIRVKLGFTTYWSLSAYVKAKAKRASSFIHDFEQAAIKYAEAKGCDGVICGHIHKVALYAVESLLQHAVGRLLQYANCGDWIESMTAIVENEAGDLEQIRWYDHAAEQAVTPV